MSLETVKKRPEFLAIQKNGRKWVSHGLIVQVMPNDLDQSRVGYTVSKKVNKRAVVRNRIKRRLREVARAVLPLYGVPPCDYVLIGRALTETRPYDTLCNDLKWCLDKMGYKKNEGLS